MRGCSGAKLFQVVQVCREVWGKGERGGKGEGLGGVGRFQHSGGSLGVQGFGDSKVLGVGSGAKAGRFFHQVSVMCCVRVCRFLYLLRFRFCDAWDV